MLDFLSLFSKKHDLTQKDIAAAIQRLGYKKDEENTFAKVTKTGRTMIWISNDGVKIKVYTSGYAESEFLHFPISNPKILRKFIKENEI